MVVGLVTNFLWDPLGCWRSLYLTNFVIPGIEEVVQSSEEWQRETANLRRGARFGKAFYRWSCWGSLSKHLQIDYNDGLFEWDISAFRNKDIRSQVSGQRNFGYDKHGSIRRGSLFRSLSKLCQPLELESTSDVVQNLSTWSTIGIPQCPGLNPTVPISEVCFFLGPLVRALLDEKYASVTLFEQLVGLKTNNARSEDIWRLSPSPSCQKFGRCGGYWWFMVAYPKNPLVNSKVIWFCQELELGIVQHQPWTAVIIDSYLYLIGA